MTATRTSRAALPYLLLAVAGLLVYWPGLSGGFFFDDFPNLVRDPDWKLDTLDPARVHRAMFSGIASDGGRPLAMLSFALNHYFTGMAPFPMKLTNLLLHLGNGALVYLLCRRLFDALQNATAMAGIGKFAAWAVALAWLLHPLQVSTVLYVVQRMELGAQGATLLALLAYFAGRRAQVDGRPAWPWFAGAGVATIIGLGFKETALLVPGYALLLELCVLRFAGRGGARARGWVAAYAIAVLVALVVFLVLVLPRYLPEAAYATRDFTLPQRLLTQLPVLAMYLKQIVLPLPATLVFHYDHLPVSTGPWSPPATAWSGALLLALAGTAWLLRRRWPLTAFGIGWFFIAHALTSNVVPLELAYEHRNYLALLGVLLALVQPLRHVTTTLSPEARVVLALLPVALLAVLCSVQASTWAQSDRLVMALATRNPDSPRAAYDLGRRFLETAGKDVRSPHWAMAQSQFRHAARLPRSSALAEQAIILSNSSIGQPVSPAIWESFRSKLVEARPGPEDYSALYGVSTCRQLRKCRFDDQQLADTFTTVLSRYPGSPTLHVQYANFALNVMRDGPLAVTMMREAVRLDPQRLGHQAGLAKFLAATGTRSDDPELSALLAQLEDANRGGALDQDLGEIRRLLAQASQHRAVNQGERP